MKVTSHPLLSAALVALLGAGSPLTSGAADDPRGPYDGDWSVVLVCADTQDRNGLVKGYDYTFRVSIVNGKLQGQYGSKDRPASVLFSGEVDARGTLELRAVGSTGAADYSVGRVARGTSYAYTMAGTLDASAGRAVRREVRPCTATFARL